MGEVYVTKRELIVLLEELRANKKELSVHIKDSLLDLELLSDLEAEIMGDERTGRPSLRADVMQHLLERDKRVESRLRFISRVSLGVLIALIIAIVVNLFGINKLTSQENVQHSTEQHEK